LKVQRDGRNVTVEVTSDGDGLVSHAGSMLLAQVADKSGLTRALSVRLADLKQRRSGHDPGRVVRDLAVMLADGGDCLADLGAMRDQDVLFGAVASDSTAFRVIDAIASTPGLLDAVAEAHAVAREHVWTQTGAPQRVTIEVDATLLNSHSERRARPATTRAATAFTRCWPTATRPAKPWRRSCAPATLARRPPLITSRSSRTRSRRFPSS
jgi:hypothetical protein